MTSWTPASAALTPLPKLGLNLFLWAEQSVARPLSACFAAAGASLLAISPLAAGAAPGAVTSQVTAQPESSAQTAGPDPSSIDPPPGPAPGAGSDGPPPQIQPAGPSTSRHQARSQPAAPCRSRHPRASHEDRSGRIQSLRPLSLKDVENLAEVNNPPSRRSPARSIRPSPSCGRSWLRGTRPSI